MEFCPAETVSFQPSAEEKKMVSLPEQILQRDDIALVGTGSLSCIRSLYLSACDAGKTHQFFPCMIPAEEYASGENGRRIETCLNLVLKVPGVGGILIYASCMDVLNQTDFDAILSSLENPERIPVKVLYRGPMVKRYMRPAMRLKELLASIPETGKVIQHDCEPLPPLGPDFNCISSFLQGMNCYPFLMTAGGCGGAVEDLGDAHRAYRLKHSRFSDIQASLGCSELIEECISQDYGNTHLLSSPKPPIFLMGSAVPAFTGLDGEAIAARLAESEMPAVYLPSDGFLPGPAGLAKALLTLGKTILKQPSQADRTSVHILGHCNALLGRKEKLSDGVEQLRNEGFSSTFWCQDGMEQDSLAALNWVVSASGLPLARWMQERFGVPYLAGIPVGASGLNRWHRQARILLGIDEMSSEPPLQQSSSLRQPRFLLVQEPLLMDSIRSFLHDDLGYVDVTMAVYAPVPMVRKFYHSVCAGMALCYFSSAEEFSQLAATMDYVIADPIFQKYLGAASLIPLPDPQLTGTQYLDIPYEIFGEKGAAYLSEKINH